MFEKPFGFNTTPPKSVWACVPLFSSILEFEMSKQCVQNLVITSACQRRSWAMANNKTNIFCIGNLFKKPYTVHDSQTDEKLPKFYGCFTDKKSEPYLHWSALKHQFKCYWIKILFFLSGGKFCIWHQSNKRRSCDLHALWNGT